jgi:hypothetical protein
MIWPYQSLSKLLDSSYYKTFVSGIYDNVTNSLFQSLNDSMTSHQTFKWLPFKITCTHLLLSIYCKIFHRFFRFSQSITHSRPSCPHYSIATPATNPPAITPTTPATFAPAAPVLCTATDVREAEDVVRAALVDMNDALLDDLSTLDIDATDMAVDLDTVAFIDMDGDPEMRDLINVGVWMVLGTPLESVGMVSVMEG